MLASDVYESMCVCFSPVTECSGRALMLRYLTARRQQVEECVCGVCGVLANAGGFVDAAGAISVCDGGTRGSNDLLSCSHYLFILLLDGLVVLLNQTVWRC